MNFKVIFISGIFTFEQRKKFESKILFFADKKISAKTQKFRKKKIQDNIREVVKLRLKNLESQEISIQKNVRKLKIVNLNDISGLTRVLQVLKF